MTGRHPLSHSLPATTVSLKQSLEQLRRQHQLILNAVGQRLAITSFTTPSSQQQGIGLKGNTLLLASAGQDGSIALWEQGKKRVQTLKVPKGGCAALAWHPTTPGFLTASTEGDLVFWQQTTQTKGFG